MNPKEKALEWLEKHGEKIREKEYDEITNKMLAFEVIGYETESIEKALDIALKEQARQILDEIEEILEEAEFYYEWNHCGGYDYKVVDEGLEKLKRKYLEGEG